MHLSNSATLDGAVARRALPELPASAAALSPARADHFDRAPCSVVAMPQRYALAFRPAQNGIVTAVVGLVQTIAQIVANDVQTKQSRDVKRGIEAAAEEVKQQRAQFEAALAKADIQLKQVDEVLGQVASPEQLDSVLGALDKFANNPSPVQAQVRDAIISKVHQRRQSLLKEGTQALIQGAQDQLHGLDLAKTAENNDHVKKISAMDTHAKERIDAITAGNTELQERDAAQAKKERERDESAARKRGQTLDASSAALKEASAEARANINYCKARELDSRVTAATLVRGRSGARAGAHAVTRRHKPHPPA